MPPLFLLLLVLFVLFTVTRPRAGRAVARTPRFDFGRLVAAATSLPILVRVHVHIRGGQAARHFFKYKFLSEIVRDI